MDILNFISWIKAGKYSSTIPTDAVTVVGVPNPTRGDAYLPVTVPVSAFTTSNTNIGKLLGGGIVVGEWDENGVKKALIASLTNLGILPWTIFPYDVIAIGASAQSYSDGLSNTNAIIAQTGVPATTAYAAGIARLYLGGGFTDWYLPAAWELNMCYNAATVVNKVLGSTNGFITGGFGLLYSSSTENSAATGLSMQFATGSQQGFSKGSQGYVRAVRIHNL
jgi:hypothetical protein